MKKMFRIMILFMAVLLTFTAEKALAQAPQGLNYQAVVRNSAGVAQISQPVGVQFKIRQGSVGGTLVYQEVFSPTTNSLGLMTLAIGQGTPQVGTFVTIDWSNSPYFLEVLIDPAGGTAYVSAGNTQFLSVPYALYSDSAGNGVSAFGGTGNTINLTLKDGSVLSYTVTGVSGPTGPQGPAGPAGATGAAGPAGATGAAGPAGATGAAGPAGPIGNTGPAGPAGATGATGTAGTNGLDGKTVLNGTSNPTGGTGVNGDFYINTTTSQIFGPKAGGVWPSGVSLVGPAGANGATGPAGDNNWTLSGSNIYSNNTGNVGVGLTAPLYKLQVTGTFLQSSGSAGFGAYDANFRVRIHHSTLQPFLVTTGSGADHAFMVNFNRGVSIGDNGVNGIGFTTPPSRGLYVEGGVQLNSLTGTGNGIVRTSSTGLLSRINETSATDVLRGDGTFGSVPGLPTGTSGQTFRFNASNALEATSSLFNRPSDGYIGIGTTTPARQLTVSGTDTAVTALLAPNGSTLYMGTSTTSNFARFNYNPATNQLKLQGTHNTSPFNDIMTFDWSSGISKIGIGAAPNVSTPSRLYVYSASGTISDNGVLFAESGASTGKAFFAKATTGTTAAGVFEAVGPAIVAQSTGGSPAFTAVNGDVYIQDAPDGIIMKGNYTNTLDPCYGKCHRLILVNGVLQVGTCFTCP
jgi:hypothetical protein